MKSNRKGKFVNRKSVNKKRRMRGGTSTYTTFNSSTFNDNGAPLDMTGRTIPFNTSTGSYGADPLVSMVDSRLIPQQSGGKRRRMRTRKQHKRRGSRKIGGNQFTRYIGSIPDSFLGSNSEMSRVSSFGSSAGGTTFVSNELGGRGNVSGSNLLPDMGPPCRAMV
jgi:hypothetical protein